MSTIHPGSSDAFDRAFRSPEKRSEAEEQWVSFQPYLQSKGYQLRPRYHPEWVPSWTISGALPSKCEDSIDALPLRVLDATRIKDQLQVVIKILIPSSEDREGEEELEILQLFSTHPYIDDPANHIVPCLDSFPIPNVEGGMFLVMPLLSKYTTPSFHDLSEIYNFLTQIFEGLEYLHTYNIAHCDVATANIMMDKRPLYDEPFHPYHQHRTLDGKRRIVPKYVRSQRPVRYYYIDFGYAKWFKDPNAPRIVSGAYGKERAPEQQDGIEHDPFKVDIYQLGAVIRRDLIPRYEPLSFLLSLARDMTDSDPQSRPTLKSARRTMETHFVGLSGWRTRWPLIPPNAPFQQRLIFIISGLTTEVVIFLRHILKLLLFQC